MYKVTVLDLALVHGWEEVESLSTLLGGSQSTSVNLMRDIFLFNSRESKDIFIEVLEKRNLKYRVKYIKEERDAI